MRLDPRPGVLRGEKAPLPSDSRMGPAPPQKISLKTRGLAGSQGRRLLLEDAGSEPRSIPEASAPREQQKRRGGGVARRGATRIPQAEGNLVQVGLA